MTKVLRRLWLGFALWVLSGSGLMPALGQAPPPPPPTAPSTEEPSIRVLGRTPALHLNAAEALYLRLQSVGLDKSRVYRVRDLSIDRAASHITLDDGTIAFSEDVAGRVTGAFFEGEGEILLRPPDQVERASLALLTGGAILEERFGSAYFRFNDNTFAELQPTLLPADNSEEFVSQWNETAVNLAHSDALRLLISLSRTLPVQGQTAEGSAAETTADSEATADHMLHVRVQGRKLGNFDVYYDTEAAEQIWAGQLRTIGGTNYYDVWTSFSLPPSGRQAEKLTSPTVQGAAVDITQYKIKIEIKPPTEIDADAILHIDVRRGGQRAILFELSRFLQLTRVEADGHPIEFIHNQAIEGTQLARRGNDLVAVVFAQRLRAGQHVELRFLYGGRVLSEAGAGLLYVGARGTWYPNLGFAMSNFDLEFRYPTGWTLLATGKRSGVTSSAEAVGAAGSPDPAAEQISHWISERPIPIAGFNLGKYERAVARAGDVKVEAYATAGVEREFPKAREETVIPARRIPGMPQRPIVIEHIPPSPARNAQKVAEASARALDFFSQRFGPYPYSELALTQMPGIDSQGWPGLIFLSSLSFLTPEEKSDLQMSSAGKTSTSHVILHETAHQWWGDLVTWHGYRDQWLAEALANYSALMVIEAQDPAAFRLMLNKYRDDLLETNKAGVPLLEDGPVTLGTRLSCSVFPRGYEAISYGRGTWLFHMLRHAMRDAEREDGSRRAAVGHDNAHEEPFVRALLRIRERYQGKPVTTREVLQLFEEELPPSFKYEGKKSLQWFYDGWVNGTAVPRFEIHGMKYFDKANSTFVSGTIAQKFAPDDLVTVVPIYASQQGKLVFLGQVFADGADTVFHLTAPAGTRKVVVDPYHTLLARTR